MEAIVLGKEEPFNSLRGLGLLSLVRRRHGGRLPVRGVECTPGHVALLLEFGASPGGVLTTVVFDLVESQQALSSISWKYMRDFETAASWGRALPPPHPHLLYVEHQSPPHFASFLGP